MIKIKMDESQGNKPCTIHLNETASQIFGQLLGPDDINDTKLVLFRLVYGIAEVNIALNRLAFKETTGNEAYISESLGAGLHVISQLYEMLDNVETKVEEEVKTEVKTKNDPV